MSTGLLLSMLHNCTIKIKFGHLFLKKSGLFFYNNKKETMGFASDEKNFNQLGFPITVRPSAMQMFYDALKPFFEKLDNNFNEGIKYLKDFDRYSVYSYLKEVYLPNRVNKLSVYHGLVMILRYRETSNTGKRGSLSSGFLVC